MPRLNLEISESVRERIERLQKQTEAESLTEVIRRALATYESLLEVSRGQLTLGVIDPDGKKHTLLLVP